MQEDFLDAVLTKKIDRLEKWMFRLQKEMHFLKNVHSLNKGHKINKKIEQLDLFQKIG